MGFRVGVFQFSEEKKKSTLRIYTAPVPSPAPSEGKISNVPYG